MAMGGIGEAMLMSAAIGGGSAALTGGDPLKGALLGGLTGGIGGAISPLLGSLGGEAATLAATQAAPAAATAATSMAPTVANAAAMNAATAAPAVTSSMSPTIANAAAMNATTPFAFPGNTAISPALTSSASGPLGTLGNGTFGILPPDPGIPALLKQSIVPPVTPAVPAGPQTFGEGMQKFLKDPIQSIKDNPMTAASAAFRGATGARKKLEEPDEYDGPLKRFKFNPSSYQPSFFAAEGGIANLAAGGYDRMVGEDPMYMSNMASGGIANLGSYSDGGRMLRGPGDGMSDSIPASISGKRPARLADGEFVVPADVVSHLGNGSTDAGAKQLYAMMNKVRQARTGRKAQGREIDPRKYTPAYA
jgi:hypothetical protein